VAAVSKRYPLLTRRGRLHSLKGALLRGELWRLQQGREGFLALSGVDLDVGHGETVAVIGPNGSGKSTLLKLVAGILRPTQGQVEVEGRVTALIELGAGFHPEISGRDNAIVNGMMLGLSRAEIMRRLPEIIEFSGIGDFVDQPVKTYSSGMYVRLGFSVAVTVEPDVLVVDEILAVGDEAFAHRCLDRIARLQRRGTAILLVSHDLGLVEQLAQRALYLRQGRLVLSGPAGVVVARYRSDVASEEAGAHVTGGSARRWGDGAVTIDSVDLLDAGGRPVRLLSSGESAAIRMTYTVRVPQEDFVFGVAIFNSLGTLCYGTNTDQEDYEPMSIRGEGRVVCRIERLNLINGTYYLDVAVHKRDGYPYDYHQNMYSFLISSAAYKDVGVARLPHRWEFSPGIAFGPPDGKKL
jgi:ABC-type polysaccharide/polyol phosphate transport system ATPase subunit